MGKKVVIKDGVSFLNEDLSNFTGKLGDEYQGGFCSVILDEHCVERLSENYREYCASEGIDPAFMILTKEIDFRTM